MEGFICLEKQERLVQFETGGKKMKELILSDANPYPGYYSETPADTQATKPKYIFAAMKQGDGCYEDIVLRAGFNLKNKVDYEFEANYGRISLFNKTKPCVRIKIDDLSKVPELIKLLKEEGIQFQPAEKVSPYDSIIRIRKHMSFNKLAEDVYSGDKENHYYIQVSEKLEWKDFEKLILSIKSSGDFGIFDAAQTSLYQKDEIIEFVRIYTKSFKTEDFVKLKDEICKRIS
ncbi:MAG: hypothetical protein L3J35_05360 [Bacteroidales bacterium]|nr:hypothetical protein [Bacteroidales bacterium]